VLSNLKHDARVRRQILAIKDKYKVTVVCFGGDVTDDYELITIAPTKLTLLRKTIASVLLLSRSYLNAHRVLHDYYYLVEKFANRKFDVVIANDVETLPLAFRFAGNPKVVFDAHEYAPRHFEDKKMWRLFFQKFNMWLCQTYIPLTAGMMTVGKGLAAEYQKHFNVSPTIITNANNYFSIDPTPIQNNTIRLIHHGIATPSRKLELMIDMMALLDSRFTLDLMLLTPGFASSKTRQYINELSEKIKSGGHARIRIIPPVASSEVVTTICNYDMGIFLLPPVNFNYENTLPNKLFDFIQARLGISIGPTPEMAEIVRTYKIGVIADDFTAKSLAAKLNALTTEDVNNFKKNSAIAATELNAEENAKKINVLLNRVLDNVE
jgi:hypothetical protein